MIGQLPPKPTKSIQDWLAHPDEWDHASRHNTHHKNREGLEGTRGADCGCRISRGVASGCGRPPTRVTARVLLQQCSCCAAAAAAAVIPLSASTAALCVVWSVASALSQPFGRWDSCALSAPRSSGRVSRTAPTRDLRYDSARPCALRQMYRSSRVQQRAGWGAGAYMRFFAHT